MLLAALCGCTSGNINNDIRKANNNFRYLDTVNTAEPIRTPVGLTPLVFSREFEIPVQGIKDSRAAILGKYVDIRPPQKLIPLDPNVVTFNDGDLSQVWFYPDEYGKTMTPNELFSVLVRFLNMNNIDIESIDPVNNFVQTDWYEGTEFATPYNTSDMAESALIYRQKYLFRLIRNSQNIPGVAVQITDNIIERPSGEELSTGLNRFEPARFSALMANRFMQSYHQQQLNIHAKTAQNLEITIGRDNNELPCWMINAPFDETYAVLTELMIDYDIRISEYSSTAGEIKIDYSELDPEDWEKHDTEPWAIDSGKYTFKIGVYDEKSTITLYDKNNQPLSSGIITRMYSGFSISLANQFAKHRKTVNHK
jgi:uncharacterized lipoprotein